MTKRENLITIEQAEGYNLDQWKELQDAIQGMISEGSALLILKALSIAYCKGARAELIASAERQQKVAENYDAMIELLMM